MTHSAVKSSAAVLLAFGILTGSVTPMLIQPAPAVAQQAGFSDVPSNYWASDFIQALVNRGVIAGFPDGSFRPEQPVTRAQFAAMIRKAFNKSAVRGSTSFNDLPSSYWANSAIQQAYTMGFMAGYPGGGFKPEQNIPRAQVLVSLANGLDYSPTASGDLLSTTYEDAAAIPNYARGAILAATEKQLVVNHPNLRQLEPNAIATRAEVAAFIYQALVSTNQVSAINSPYIVAVQPEASRVVRIPAGSTITLRYDRADKILLAQNEPQPAPVTMTVSQNILTEQGRVVIPAGSQVSGELQVVQGGAKFIAREIQIPGSNLNLNADSNLITKKETIKKGTSTTKIIAGTVVGAGAAAAIAGVTGDRVVKTEEVLGGAAAGALLSVFAGKDKVELIAINPDTDLNLTLRSDLTLP
jgi:hypothetical protein